jgi:hypothetical protein
MTSRRRVIVILAAIAVALGLSPLPERLDDLLGPQQYGDNGYGGGSYGGLSGPSEEYEPPPEGPWPPNDQ